MVHACGSITGCIKRIAIPRSFSKMATCHSRSSSDESTTTSDHEDTSSQLMVDSHRIIEDRIEERERMKLRLKDQVFGGVLYEELSKNAQKRILNFKLKQIATKKIKNTLLEIPMDNNGNGDSSDNSDGGDGSDNSDGGDNSDGSDGGDGGDGGQRIKPLKRQKELQRIRLREALKDGLRVAIDCSMGDCMSPNEICKLAKHINFVYSSVLAAEKPFHLYLTGLCKDSSIHTEIQRQCFGFDNYILDKTELLHHETFPTDQLIYLTPDSPNILHTIDYNKVYVVGGLVDQSLSKSYTYKNAKRLQLNTARLPVDVYMDKTNPSSHCCLPINQVIDILLDVYNGIDWPTALQKHIAPRKRFVLKPSYTRSYRTKT